MKSIITAFIGDSKKVGINKTVVKNCHSFITRNLKIPKGIFGRADLFPHWS